MRLCYVSYEFPPQFGGGIGTYVGNISKDMAEVGHDVHVLTFNPGGLPETEYVTGVTVHRITMAASQLDVIEHASSTNLSTLLYWSLYSEKVYHALKLLHATHDFDIIEFCDYRGEAYFAALAKRVKGEFKDVQLVIRLHTPLLVLNTYNKAERDPGMDQLVHFENAPILLADHVVSPSQVLANMIQRELGIAKQIDVLPHPIDLDSFSGDMEHEDSNVVLYVGRLEHRKGVVDLVQAATSFLRATPMAVLKMIGGDTYTAPSNTSMVRYLKSLIPNDVESRIQFADKLPRDEVIQQYRTARLCVFPSLFENFPNVCLEAMASGVPVLVSENSGMAEMVQDNVSGVVFKAGDRADLECKLHELYHAPFDERQAMAHAGRRRVEERYAKSTITRLQTKYFERISVKKVTEGGFGNSYLKGLVSVVIPCYNHGAFIEETIESVRSNTYRDVEIIVVNDGSTDAYTLDVLEKISSDNAIKVIHQPNGGLSAARNAGVRSARGEFILPLDADDLIAPDFLEKTVPVLEADQSIGFVYTYVQYFGAADGVWKTPEFDANLLLVSNLCVASALYRHTAFDKIGGYKTDMVYGFEDWDFWIYMVEHGWTGKCIQEPLFFYRKHKESMLSGSQRNRSFLIEKLIEHHADSYKRSLTYVIVEKDKYFFDAHMSNYASYTQLNSILSSKAWKVVATYRKVKDKLKSLVEAK